MRRPGSAVFEPAIKGKAYPYGTAIHTGPSASAGIALSANDNDSLELGPGTQVSLDQDGSDPQARVLRLDRGKVISSMQAGNAEKSLTIETPVARCYALAGHGVFELSSTPTTFELSLQAEGSGSMAIAGPQFRLPVLKNGFSARIVSMRDQSLTRILNTLGDYTVLIENGSDSPIPIETTTKSSIRIWREHAPVGGRLIISVLATDAHGKGRECLAFAIGQPSVAAGMLLQTQDEADTNAPPEAVAAPAEGETQPDAATAPSSEEPDANTVTPTGDGAPVE